MRQAVQSWLQQLAVRRARTPEAGPAVLHRHRIFILPTRHGFVFAVLLFAMLMGSINYASSLGFVLTFLLASMATVSMLHTYRNLAGLQLRAGKAEPVFAGQAVRFQVGVENPGRLRRYSLGIQRGDTPAALADLKPGKTVFLSMDMPTIRRGRVQPGRFTVFTQYPLGLFRAWSWVNLDMHGLVYPKPETTAPAPPSSAHGNAQGKPVAGEGDDFDSLRNYRLGDPLRHVAWKAAARTDKLMTKRFQSLADQAVWLDWEAAGNLDTEARLSRLCRWVLEAEATGQRFGLRLPDATVAPGSGEQHKQRCLEALALFGLSGVSR